MKKLYKLEIIENIANKNLQVGVIGLGYVGLPLAVEKQIRSLI